VMSNGDWSIFFRRPISATLLAICLVLLAVSAISALARKDWRGKLAEVEAGEERVRSHTGTARELVTDILRIRWDRVFNSPAGGILKLLISEAGNFPDLARWYHDEIVVRANASLEQALELGIQRGEFRRLDIQQAVYLALAPAVMAGLWKRSFMRAVQPPFDPSEYLESWIQTFLRGIESRPQREESHA